MRGPVAMASPMQTPNRLALLRSVDAGKVRHYTAWGRAEGHSVDQVRDRPCTSEVAELRRAGLVQLQRKRTGDFSLKWELTDAGRAYSPNTRRPRHRNDDTRARVEAG